MTFINPAAAYLAHIIHTQLASARGLAAGAGVQKGAATSAHPAGDKPALASSMDWKPSTTPALESLIALRVGALDRDDPQRRRKAFKIFLEATLANELGFESIDVNGFDALIEQVLSQMELDPGLRSKISDAADLLLA